MLVWSILGCLLLLAAVPVIVGMEGASLGPYSTRIVAIGALCAGYYGALAWLRFGQARAQPHWPLLRYALPAAAALTALYCLWHIVRNWRAEMHGLLKTVLKLALVLVLGALAWLCFTR